MLLLNEGFYKDRLNIFIFVLGSIKLFFIFTYIASSLIYQ